MHGVWLFLIFLLLDSPGTYYISRINPDWINLFSQTEKPRHHSASPPSSWVQLSDEELRGCIERDVRMLGAMSIGFPNGGALLNGRQMPLSGKWEVINPKETWGTDETIQFIQTAINIVHELFPDTPPLYIGDISDPNGGRLNLHTSHQSGRDADLGFYYKGGKGIWHRTGNSKNLDLPRNWALVRALVVHTDVQVILLDRRIQKLLFKYALSIGEDRDWLHSVFQHPGGRGKTIIRHERRHRTHYHVRFYNRRAQELGIKAYSHLLELKIIKPPVTYITHRVRHGQTLGHLARRYGSSVRDIQRANGLRGTLIRAGRRYRIPIRDGVSRVPKTIEIPPRRLPPMAPRIFASVDWMPAVNPVPVLTPSLISLQEPAIDEDIPLYLSLHSLDIFAVHPEQLQAPPIDTTHSQLSQGYAPTFQ